MILELNEKVLKLELAKNALCVDSNGKDLRRADERSVTVNKVSVLIGKNGSGKSLILESALRQNALAAGRSKLKVISFSSGQNEGYSQIIRPYLAKMRKEENAFDLNCYHFDKFWAKLLIFLATASNSYKYVRKSLVENGYVDESATDKSDTSTILRFPFKVGKDYQQKVKAAMNNPNAVDSAKILNNPFHINLVAFIRHVVDPDYNFEEPLKSRTIELRADRISGIPLVQQPDVGFSVEVNFFVQAADNNQFIDKTKLQLIFKNNVEMDKISDGEFQMLFIYALIDLFDSSSTLFLIDEADSHLHYEIIMKMWEIFYEIKGFVLTATHQIDTISAAKGIEHLKIVSDGTIKEDLLQQELVKPKGIISRAEKFEYELYGKLENLVIMDNTNDWTIVKKLAERSGENIDALSSITAISMPSTCHGRGNRVGQEKFELVEDLKKYWNKNNFPFQTKRIFMINDRDNGNFEWENDGVQIKSDGVKLEEFRVKKLLKELKNNWRLATGEMVEVYFLVWKHREIENYLLSRSALEIYGGLEKVNDELAVKYQLKGNEPCDNEQAKLLDVKRHMQDIIGITDNGFDERKVQNYINHMQPSEISVDIPNVSKFIHRRVVK